MMNDNNKTQPLYKKSNKEKERPAGRALFEDDVVGTE